MRDIFGIWKIAYDKMLERYGKQVPWQILNRFEQERLMMSYSGLQMLDFLSELQSAAREAKAPIALRGTYPASFIGYLLGASDINPLSAHYVCPKCGLVEFVDGTRDGFDLPEKKCSCGTEMLGDGHNIPVEVISRLVFYRAALECNIPSDFLPTANGILRDFWSETYDVVPVRLRDVETETQIARYKMFPRGTAPALDEKGVLWTDTNEYWTYYDGLPTVMLISLPFQEALEASWHKAGRLPTSREFCEEENLRAWLRDSAGAGEAHSATLRKSLMAAVSGQPVKFSTLVQAKGFAHGTAAWENNGEKLVAQGMDFMGIPADREGVFLHLINRYPEVQGLAERVMEETHKGKFARNGMPIETENALHALQIEPWFIDYCKTVGYLFPKAHSVELLLQELMQKWLERHGYGVTGNK